MSFHLSGQDTLDCPWLRAGIDFDASKIPPNWGWHGNPPMGDGLRQGCLGVQDACDADAPIQDGEADLGAIAAEKA
jgi:hypothetical protein